MAIRTISAVALFTPPSVEEVAKMVAEDYEDSTNPATAEDVQKSIEKAVNWIEEAARMVNSTFVFTTSSDSAKVTVGYVEGEDLGYTCKNPGPLPFNNVYPAGPTVHVVLSGNVSVLLNGAFASADVYQDVIFESFYQYVKGGGSLLICYLQKYRMYVAILNE